LIDRHERIWSAYAIFHSVKSLHSLEQSTSPPSQMKYLACDYVEIAQPATIPRFVLLEEMSILIEEGLERFNGRGKGVMELAKHRGSFGV
jgi:hypothetical protein